MIAPELDVIEEICSAKNVRSSERVFLGRVGDKFVVVVTHTNSVSVSVISCDDPSMHPRWEGVPFEKLERVFELIAQKLGPISWSEKRSYKA
jgi:hypothetical protein